MINGKIYMITNNINNMKYIGQTKKEVSERIKDGYALTTQIGAALNTHGGENFTYMPLEIGITTQEKLNDRENYYIDLYNTLYPNGYNERKA